MTSVLNLERMAKTFWSNIQLLCLLMKIVNTVNSNLVSFLAFKTHHNHCKVAKLRLRSKKLPVKTIRMWLSHEHANGKSFVPLVLSRHRSNVCLSDDVEPRSLDMDVAGKLCGSAWRSIWLNEQDPYVKECSKSTTRMAILAVMMHCRYYNLGSLRLSLATDS